MGNLMRSETSESWPALNYMHDNSTIHVTVCHSIPRDDVTR